MADFYGTSAGFRAYHVARGNDVPAEAADDTTVNEWLLVASEWIDGRFSNGFPGIKVGMREQVREWPRSGAADRYGYAILAAAIPDEIERATYEAALRHGNDPTALAKDHTPSKYKSVSVEGAISVQFAGGDAADFQTEFPIIGRILAPILTGGGAVSPLSGRIVRA